MMSFRNRSLIEVMEVMELLQPGHTQLNRERSVYCRTSHLTLGIRQLSTTSWSDLLPKRIQKQTTWPYIDVIGATWIRDGFLSAELSWSISLYSLWCEYITPGAEEHSALNYFKHTKKTICHYLRVNKARRAVFMTLALYRAATLSK